MEKESIIALQNFDCNCNSCAFMDRDLVESNLWSGYWEALDYFIFLRERRHELSSATNLIYGDGDKFEIADCKLDKVKGFKKRKQFKPTAESIKQGKYLETKARKMKFQFDSKKLVISYGICLNRNGKWNQPITFIPNIFQFDTQHCFKNRKEA